MRGREREVLVAEEARENRHDDANDVRHGLGVPAEVELLNEVSRLERAIAETPNATARQSLKRALTDRQTQLAVLLEHRSRRQR